MLKILKIASVLILSVVTLTGCFSPNPEEKLVTLFENAAKQEDGFQPKVVQIEGLEKKDEERYKDILEKAKKNNDSVKSLADEGINASKEREQLVNEQLTMLKAAFEETSKADDTIKNIADETVKDQASKAQKLYVDRYNAFIKLADNYKTASTLEQELYGMLNQKDTDLKKISENISKLNEKYKEINVLTATFNELTKKYNDQKVAFYKAANIKFKE